MEKPYHEIYKEPIVQAKHGYPLSYADPTNVSGLQRDEGPPRK